MPKIDKEALKNTGLVADEVHNETVEQTSSVKPSGSQPDPVKKSGKFTALKQEKIADVITGKGGDSVAVAPGIATRSLGSYGGDAVQIAGSLAATPNTQGGTRGTSRFGKKIDPITRALNDLGSEQVVVEVKGSKPLNESPNSVQGYSGRKLNDQVVRQKVVGVSPASSQFQRSLDELRREELLFGAGQNVKNPNIQYFDTPTISYNAAGDIQSTLAWSERGNFIPYNLNVVIGTDNEVTHFEVQEHDVSITETNNIVLDASSQHAKLHVNSIELTRREMEIKSADESADGWSPLSRSVDEPKQVLSYLKDIEQDTGNHAYMANRIAKMALSYQVNRAGKDGSDVQMGMVEALLEPYLGGMSRADLVTNGHNSVVDVLNNHDAKRNGSAALLIAAFDSLRKYNNKADVLSQPRSLKMHVNVGNNHINGLKANANFIKLVENTQMFSTIDHEYDGIKPVMVNNAYRIASPISWANAFYLDSSTNVRGTQGFRYRYNDDRNSYTTHVKHPLLEGIYDWFVNNAASIRNGANAGNAEVTLNVPIEYSITGLSAWQFIVNSAMSLIKEARIVSLRDLITYSEYHSYPFTDLIDLDASMTTNAKNFSYKSIDDPLVVGLSSKESALTWKMPELFWAVDETGDDDHKIVMPWYMSEYYLERDGEDYAIREGERIMNFPIIRAGNVLQGLLDVHDIGERDTRLLFDIMVRPFNNTVDPTGLSVYKYDRIDSGIITLDEDVVGTITVNRLLTEPRELGLRVVTPRGFITPYGGSRMTDLDVTIADRVGYVAKYYYILGRDPLTPSRYALNTQFTQSPNIASLFTQQWNYVYAGDTSITNNNGMHLGLPMVIIPPDTRTLVPVPGDRVPTEIETVEGATAFTPFITYDESGDPVYNNDHSDYQLYSMHSHFWFRAQMLPFVINPFDITFRTVTGNENTVKYDIFDFAYMFGLAGFQMSDFSEDQYLRSEKDLLEGHVYVNDRYIEDTLLLK